MKIYKIILLIIILSFAGCKDKHNVSGEGLGNDKDLESLPTPTIAGIDKNNATPIPSKTPDDSILDAGADEWEPIYLTSIDHEHYTLNYFNYYNRLPTFIISNYEYKFTYDGYISLYESDSAFNKSFHIMDYLDVSSYIDTPASSGDWYYMGHLLTNDYIFVRYDYMGDMDYSFLIKLDYSLKNLDICAVAPYQSNESMNNFIILDDFIYYTDITPADNSFVTSLIRLSFSKDDKKVVYTFDADIEIHYLFPYEGSLYMLCRDSLGIKSLWQYGTVDAKLNLIVNNCTADFLFIYDNCALLSIYNHSYLNYYNMNTKKYYNLRLTSENNSYFSTPCLSSEGIYMAVFSWDDSSETKLARLDLVNKTIDKYVLLSKQFYRCLGITDDILYVEDGETYKKFNILTGAEITCKIETTN